MRHGPINGREFGWARAQNGPAATRVWLDYRANSGNDWYQCGPTQRGTVGNTFTLATLTYPSNAYVMRACADAPGAYSGYGCTTPLVVIPSVSPDRAAYEAGGLVRRSM